MPVPTYACPDVHDENLDASIRLEISLESPPSLGVASRR